MRIVLVSASTVPLPVFVAAIVNRDLPKYKGVPAAIAAAGSIIAGTATVEALFQAHW